MAALTVFFDDRPEVLVSVEGRPADLGPFGDVGEAHRLSVTNQLGARMFDSSQGVGRRTGRSRPTRVRRVWTTRHWASSRPI